MRILKVIHGYPMRFNAGSEVYTQTLCRALAKDHEVHVFTREEDTYAPDFRLRSEGDPSAPGVRLHLVNMARQRDRYRFAGVDARFLEVVQQVRPDIVHIGHLNHLSTSIVTEASRRGVPVVFTLHDFWLACPRGQFIQSASPDGGEVWAHCDGQEDKKCAERCYSRYFSGDPEESGTDAAYWTEWIGRRMRHIRNLVELVDAFICPSMTVLERHRLAFGLSMSKFVHLPYGFNLARLSGRRRIAEDAFVFGYIGTHTPAKGIDRLIRAFGRLDSDVLLRIWGRPRGEDTEALRQIACELGSEAQRRIEWMGEYKNDEIVTAVFNHVDAIVVPSIWEENSPLVVQEAQQARVPVIAPDIGGFRELVQHKVNGLLFAFRDDKSLAEQMRCLAEEPVAASRLGAVGSLTRSSGDIEDIEDHVPRVLAVYEDAIARRNMASTKRLDGPWRITFDTNPDTCNLSCVMCEEHSPLSDRQKVRRADGRPPRLMPISLIRRVLTEAAKNGLREVIPSTMGEPLLYEHFEEIVSLCHANGVKLNLTTNGTWPGRGARHWAELIVPVTSDVKISWNSATGETAAAIMTGIVFEKALADVAEFIAVRDDYAANGGNRCRVTFQMTFLETNVDEIVDLVKLAASIGVDRLKGHHVWAHFDSLREASMRRSRESIERWNRIVDAVYAAARDFPNKYGHHLILENFDRLDAELPEELHRDGVCPFLGQEAWIDTEGRFNPCCAPDELRRGLGEFGNLNTSTMSEIWHGGAYRDLCATYSARTLCRSCNMRKPGGAS